MATLFQRIMARSPRQNRTGVDRLTGRVTTSASGAIASQDCPGFTVTKTSAKTGRYDVQMVNADGGQASVAMFAGITVTVITTTADAAYTTGKGLSYVIRNEDPTNGKFQIQFNSPVTSGSCTWPDTELEDGAKFLIALDVKLSSVTP